MGRRLFSKPFRKLQEQVCISRITLFDKFLNDIFLIILSFFHMEDIQSSWVCQTKYVKQCTGMTTRNRKLEKIIILII